MILMAPQQATSPGFNTHGISENICPFGVRRHSEDAQAVGGKKSLITVLHRKEIYHVRCSSKRRQI
jgi:hypothetical protein